MHADVRNVRCHALNRSAPTNLQKLCVAHRIELEQRRAVLKTLRPLGPAARGVSAFHGEDGRSLIRLPVFFDGEDFLPGKLEHALDFFNKFLRRELFVNFDWHLVDLLNCYIVESEARCNDSRCNAHSLRKWNPPS